MAKLNVSPEGPRVTIPLTNYDKFLLDAIGPEGYWRAERHSENALILVPDTQAANSVHAYGKGGHDWRLEFFIPAASPNRNKLGLAIRRGRALLCPYEFDGIGLVLVKRVR